MAFLTMWEVAETAETAETAATAAEVASAAEVANAAAATNAVAQVGSGLSTLGTLGTTGAELGGVGSGITQANLASDVISGGAGAGQAGINEALVNSQQNLATSIPNSGFTGELPANYQPLSVQAGPGVQVADAGVTNPYALTNPGTTVSSAASPYALTSPGPTIPSTTYSLNTPPAVGQGITMPGAGTSMSGAGMEGAGTGITNASANSLYSGYQPSALERGLNAATEFAKTNPYITGFLGLKAIGAFDRPQLSNFNAPAETYNGPLSKYELSPDFQGYTPKQNPYKWHYAEGGITQIAAGGPVEQMSNQNAIGANTGYPQSDMNTSAYATPFQIPNPRSVVTGSQDVAVDPYTGEQKFAGGGIASYKGGGNLSSSLDYYTNMMDGHNDVVAPERHMLTQDLVRDTDPDTMYLSAPEAAAVKLAKLRKRAYMQGPSLKRPTPLGQLNLAPPGVKGEAGGGSDTTEAAHGGIMQVGGHLGGYAAGGNPRLLKGPGDGMSDDIPATIANKQPARLADGEFVVPADVVSHLGNGSTDAGAKKLHTMMTNVRKARTGNPKQGKQINPNRFMPK
jgi:hypothetical protein